MGYATTFDGYLTITPEMKPEHIAYINQFSQTRRMARNADETAKRPDPIRKAAGLPIGPEGAYFVGGIGFFGQENSPDVIGHNTPPEGQPGLWCQWIVAEVPAKPLDVVLVWDGDEEFSCYEEWLSYLIEHFFKPWGYTLEGTIQWQGQNIGDQGLITVKNNVLSSQELV